MEGVEYYLSGKCKLKLERDVILFLSKCLERGKLEFMYIVNKVLW